MSRRIKCSAHQYHIKKVYQRLIYQFNSMNLHCAALRKKNVKIRNTMVHTSMKIICINMQSADTGPLQYVTDDIMFLGANFNASS